MRTARILLLLITLPLISVAAPRGDDAAARTTILSRFDAALRGDTAALDKLLADDLAYCNWRAECESKSQYIGEIKSGFLKYKAIVPTVESVKLFADTAVVSGKVKATATRDGVERTIHAAYLAVLVWRDDRWQLTNWGTTLLELQEPKQP